MVPLFLLFIETVVRHRTSATPIQDRAVSTFPFGPPGEMLRRSGRRRSRLDFGSSTGPFCAFIEVKTHEGWDEAHVARQVAVQAGRTPVRVPRDVRGSVLLAPERVCRRVAARAPAVRAIPWRRLVDELRALPSTSPLTKLAIQHLEENVDRTAGLDRPMTLNHFEQATTTIACLREFLVDCISEIDGHVQGDPLYMTPGDGKPHRGSGWAWHGIRPRGAEK
jgi:hypothetical protein